MRLYDYIWDRRFLILLYLITSLLTGTIIYMEEAGSLIDSTGLYATEISLFLFLFYLMIDFILRRKHCITLKKLLLINDMDWINSMPKPFDSEQRVYDELLHKFYQDSYKKMEEHGSKSREDLEFITMWVHEIKTPISTISLACEMLSDKSSTMDSEQKSGFVSIIAEENKRLAAMTEKILQTAILERGHMDLKKERTDIHAPY